MARELTEFQWINESAHIDWDAGMARTMLKLFGMNVQIDESLPPDEFRLVDSTSGRAVAGYRNGRIWTAN